MLPELFGDLLDRFAFVRDIDFSKTYLLGSKLEGAMRPHLMWRKANRLDVLEERPDTVSPGKPTMPGEPEPPRPISWEIVLLSPKIKLLGTVEAADATEAVEKATKKFKTEASKLVAVPRQT
jgi:hypothetical protein